MSAFDFGNPAMSDPSFHRNPANGRVIDPTVTPGQRTYAMLTHLTLLLAQFTGLIIIAPLVMWLIKRGESPFLDDHGKEALNFQISLLIYYIVSAILCAIVVGIPLLLATWILGLVGMIMGAVAANRGEYFRYPMTIRMIS